MKTFFTPLLIVLCLFTNTLFAQLKLFGGLDLLCGWSAGCDEINSSYKADSEYKFTDTGIYGSYGAGSSGGLNAGVNICGDPVDVLLAAYYFRGKEITYFIDQSGYGGNINGTFSERASGFMIEPRLRFRTNNEGKINFYANAGLLVPVGVKNVVQSDITSSGYYFNSILHSVLKKKGAMSLGYSGGVGITYSLTSMIALAGELYYRGINVPWKKASLTEYTSTSGNQVTTLAQLDVNQKEFEYEKEITDADNNSVNTPTIALKDYDPLSSWGIKIGLQLMFGGPGGSGKDEDK